MNLFTKEKSKAEILCYLWLVFLVGCLSGWIYEEIFYWITEGMLRNRGILYGPWLPIYGIGALPIFFMKPLKKNPIALFALCVLATAVVEYIIGYVGINYLGMRLWDYRGLFLNIDGIICLRSVLSFAVMGVAFHYIIEPLLEKGVDWLESRKTGIICIAIAIVFVIDCILSALFRTPITY